jgi:proteic killer suppression protein
MIVSFGDASTRDVYDGVNSKEARAIPLILWTVIRRKLDWLDKADGLADLATPPGNRLEALRGNMKGFYSIRVNDQYRIVFGFTGGKAADVRVVDYH